MWFKKKKRKEDPILVIHELFVYDGVQNRLYNERGSIWVRDLENAFPELQGTFYDLTVYEIILTFDLSLYRSNSLILSGTGEEMAMPYIFEEQIKAEFKYPISVLFPHADLVVADIGEL